MNEHAPVLATTIYHPKAGSEEMFVKLWSERIARLAYSMGADSAHIYHNENTDEYLASVHWPSKKLAIKFLNSEEFLEATKDLNVYSLIPSTKNHFEILQEKAA